MTAVKKNNLRKNKKGSLMWELLLVIGVLFVILWGIMSILGVYVQYEKLSFAVKSVTRQIEIAGSFNESTATAEVSDLIGPAFDNVRVTITPGPFPNESMAEVMDASQRASLAQALRNSNRLQLRQKFTVTVTATYTFQITGMNEDWFTGTPMTISMDYSTSGMSEKYWRS